MKNSKSDFATKVVSTEELSQRSFENMKVAAAPADIDAEKDRKKAKRSGKALI